MARYRTAFGLLIALAVALVWACPVRAYEEQASLDAALGYVLLLDSESLPEQGASIDVGGALGISDVAIVRGLIGYAPLFDPDAARHAGRLRVEALYLLDVLRIVPFFGLGAGLLVADGGDVTRVLPGGHIVVGLDYLVSRTWTVGVDIRPGIVLEHGRAVSSTEGALRVSRMFELF